MDENIRRPNLPPNGPVQPPIALIQPPNGPVQPLDESFQPPSALIPPPVGPIQLTDEVHKLINKIAESENLFNTEIEVSEATEKGDNYLGQLLRVRVSDKKQQKSQNFIVKNAPNNPILRKMMPVEILYKRETAAYKTILPALYKVQVKYTIPIEERFSYAKFYGCIEDLEKESIILEDLSTTGFRMYNRKISFDKQHLELVIRTLARFHATSFVLRKTHPKFFKELSDLAAKDLDMMENSEQFINDAKNKCLDMIRDPEIRKRVEQSTGNSIQIWRKYLMPERTEPYNVICHGDCWINNFLFKYENDRVKEMKIIDLQIIRLASPITDLAYMIFSGTDSETRANYYASALDLYYQTLDSSITRMGHKTSLLYPMHVFKDQIQSTMLLGLLTGMMLVPMMLSDKENAPDMETMTEAPDASMYDKIMNQGCQDRISGIANDFAAYGFI